jgi:Calcineurin-like phosphoesterase
MNNLDRAMNNLDRALQAITDHKKELVAVVVHLNDTYLIDDRPKRQLPGFAKIIATINQLRTHIENETGKDLLLVVHSGDFLSPSLVGRKDKGAAMVALLNMARVKYCVLGNHEFDDGARVLARRLRQANFKVLLANATDRTNLIKQDHPTPPRRPINIEQYVVWPEGDSPPRVALTGVVSADVRKSFVSPHRTQRDAKGNPVKVEWNFTPPNEAVIQAWNAIKNGEDDASTTKVALTTNIPFRFVLTHATQIEDNQLRRQITETPRTYILGGHDHHIQHVDYDEKIFIGKNLANAETMRVMLPLAGGRSICNEVDAACARLQARQRKALRYPEDLEAVLLTASDLDRKVLRDRIKEAAARVGGFRNLKEALKAARSEVDIPAFVLTYADHELVDEDAADIIRKALTKVKRKDDNEDVCDFTGTIAKFEARDGFIRLVPTNMGVFVAECVRLEAEDRRPAGDQDPVVAIINSGAFRCDSELEPKLRVRDLRETFLFDNDEAIMVLKVNADVVDKLIKHGQTKPGTGAFPQFAGHRKGTTGTVWLAISSFLLTRSDNNDGYDEVLHESWGSPPPKGKGLLDPAATQKEAIKDAKPYGRFSIIDAVKERAKTVKDYPPKEMPSEPKGKAVKGTDRTVKLLQTYVETFYKETRPHANSFSNKDNFQEWLGTDEPISQWPAIQRARNNVRKFLRQLPTVAAYSNVAAHSNTGSKGKTASRKAWTAAQIELLALQKSLLNKDDLTLPERVEYFWLFDLAARGIPGWGNLPALT